MSLRNTVSTYGSVAKFFHWLIFLLLFFMIVFGFFLEDLPKDYQPVAYNLHKLTGLTILALMVLRGFWALVNPKPALPADTLAWQRMAERIVHFLFYVAVITMPLAGWIGSVAGGRPPHLGDFKFTLPIEQNKALAEAAFELHGIVAIVIIVLFVIHVTAALYHHYIKRDDVLRRMLPYSGHR
ncbi:cytochrome b [Aquicella lusitana]|uniref:Cytochrome b561 n=1 Tax=Aquicella lusitana TaxID=254246 RepID=A0A370GS09_9COXI|nr:cytochrome b [Aquicella lusitana]RDI46482.1 cytochrome b561 [Aquicella lusitana]VVC74146.1 hypothetical protein AQULUS_19110 [Aquicella lusitana]